MATVAIVLNTTKKLSNDEFSVALRVTHNREKKYYSISSLVVNQSLKFRCEVSEWRPAEVEDNGFGKFLKSFDKYKECNAILEAKLLEAKDILRRYDAENLAFDFRQFDADLKKKETPLITSLQEYYNLQISILEQQGRMGLAGLYYEVQRILKKYKPNAQLSDINFRFLESFEYWLRNERGNKDTTISVKMRNLQRILNQAIEDKLLKQENYPFGEKKYSINKRLDSRTRKLAITLDKVGKLKQLQLEPGTAVHFAQSIFLFSYYCRGMNFIDIAYLKWNDISETHITYVRRKTGARFDIPLNEHNQRILTYFKNNFTIQGGFVFPIFDPIIHKSLKKQYTRKKTALSAVNYNLKKLAKMIGEENLKLSTNVGRHSYATGLKRSGAITSHITQALGHATESQTQTYLDEFETGVIESWENKMFDM